MFKFLRKMEHTERSCGFTLVEVIVAIALLGIIAVAFVPLFTSSTGMVYHAGNKNEALSRAQMEMENLMADKAIRVSPPAFNINDMTVNNTITEGYITISTGADTPPLDISVISGRLIRTEVDYNRAKRKAVLNSFIPDD